MRKILIVDDEPNIVMTLEYAFKKKGYEVFIARDGSEAMEILKHNVPDMVLLDIMMPQVDGYQTLEWIRENEELKNVKVIFLTAKNKSTDVEKGMNLGVNKYMTKPFSVKKIVNEVTEMLA
ncbi:response regulator transcription factor [Crocinitomix catalasitica]|uniref:response regulator transcription factor n=1 Tax=Crocinitomix catalasitica TaxID=184607 RepID=UPI000480E004|nr:response regulator [Crocinitomix catalasitica]